MSNGDEKGLRNSDQIVCFAMWGFSALKATLQIHTLKGSRFSSKSPQNAPQDLPNPPEIAPKSLSDGTRSSLGEYVEPLIEKNLIFNAKEVAQRRPGASGKAKMD